MNESDLIAEAKAGNRLALDRLIADAYPKCLRVAQQRLPGSPEAEDVTQIAFIKACRSLEHFAERARFSTWVSKIVYHEAISNRRARWPFASLEELELRVEDSDIDDWLRDRNADIESDAVRAQVRVLVKRALDRLPPRQREMVRLHFCEDWPHEQVAAHFHMNTLTVRQQIHHALGQLRRAVLWVVLPKRHPKAA